MMVRNKWVCMLYNFVVKEPTLVAITLGEFILNDGKNALWFSSHLPYIANQSEHGIRMMHLLLSWNSHHRELWKPQQTFQTTGHLWKTQTIVTGELWYVNCYKRSICWMEQLPRFFRSWQSPCTDWVPLTLLADHKTHWKACAQSFCQQYSVSHKTIPWVHYHWRWDVSSSPYAGDLMCKHGKETPWIPVKKKYQHCEESWQRDGYCFHNQKKCFVCRLQVQSHNRQCRCTMLKTEPFTSSHLK